MIDRLNTSSTLQQNQNIELISLVGYNLLSLSFESEKNETLIEEAFNLIDLILIIPNEVIFETQKQTYSSSK